MKTPAETRHILHKLETQHPGPDREPPYPNRFELLVATILSAQCTDVRVNMVTPALFKRYPDARALANANPSEVEELIKSAGFFRAKTKSLLSMSKSLVDDHNGEVPRALAELVKLGGVG